jgi:hypothetical protein
MTQKNKKKKKRHDDADDEPKKKVHHQSCDGNEEASRRKKRRKKLEKGCRRICELVMEECDRQKDAMMDMILSAIDDDEGGHEDGEMAATTMMQQCPRAVDAARKISRIKEMLKHSRRKAADDADDLRNSLQLSDSKLKEAERSRQAALDAADCMKKRAEEYCWKLYAKLSEAKALNQTCSNANKRVEEMETKLQAAEEENARCMAEMEGRCKKLKAGMANEMERCKIVLGRIEEENRHLLEQCQSMELKHKALLDSIASNVRIKVPFDVDGLMSSQI